MISVNAIYENGEVRLLEAMPQVERAKVIVTFVEELPVEPEATNPHLFDDLIGAASAREDGSREHDRYLGEA